MTTTKTIQGVNFKSEAIDVTKARPSDLIYIASYLFVTGDTLPTSKETIKAIKEKGCDIEIIKNPKMFELNAKFI
jgi:hypothetical protein